MHWKHIRVRRPPHSLEVFRNGQDCKQRLYHVVSRMGPEHTLGVFNNSVDTVERALLERYFLVKVGDEFVPPLASDKGAWKEAFLLEFRAGVVSEVKPHATVLTLLEVVKCYSGAKRKLYESAHRSLMRVNLNRGDASLRPFAKFEKQCLTKAARIINPRSPRYNLTLGRYIKRLEKDMYAAINQVWNSTTTHTVVKGLNVFDSARVLRAKWCRFRCPVAIGLDATKFDMHVGIPALVFEHGFYNLIFGTRELRTLLSLQILNTGTAHCTDGKVQFRMPGTRCSGDLNTSLGNCLIMCALIWAMCKELGICAELANNGDDCVVILEQDDEQELMDYIPVYFERHGFRMTVEQPVYEFEQIEFCQSKPVKLGRGWAMVRNVRTCLKKDPICLIPIQNDKVWRKWLGAVGECGLASVPGCPVLQSFYGAFFRSGIKSTQKFKNALFRNTSMMERTEGLKAKSEAITPEARASFYLAFGVTPDYQIALEDYYDKMEIGGYTGTVPLEGVVPCESPAYVRHL